MVSEFGVTILSEEMKTPTLLYMLYTSRHKIHDHQEFRTRQQNSSLTEERVKSLIYSVTGDAKTADKAASYFVLEQTRKK